MNNKKILYLVQAAVIAALYVVLTVLANALGIASGNIQVRFSEALCVLPFFTTAAVPGLYLGCLLANLLIGSALPDIIIGPIPTLIGAVGTWYLGKLFRRQSISANTDLQPRGNRQKGSVYKWLSPLPPIIANALIIPPMLKYAYGIIPVWFSFITVTIGEIISCGVLGLILLFALQKHGSVLFPKGDD